MIVLYYAPDRSCYLYDKHTGQVYLSEPKWPSRLLWVFTLLLTIFIYILCLHILQNSRHILWMIISVLFILFTVFVMYRLYPAYRKKTLPANAVRLDPFYFRGYVQDAKRQLSTQVAFTTIIFLFLSIGILTMYLYQEAVMQGVAGAMLNLLLCTLLKNPLYTRYRCIKELEGSMQPMMHYTYKGSLFTANTDMSCHSAEMTDALVQFFDDKPAALTALYDETLFSSKKPIQYLELLYIAEASMHLGQYTQAQEIIYKLEPYIAALPACQFKEQLRFKSCLSSLLLCHFTTQTKEIEKYHNILNTLCMRSPQRYLADALYAYAKKNYTQALQCIFALKAYLNHHASVLTLELRHSYLMAQICMAAGEIQQAKDLYLYVKNYGRDSFFREKACEALQKFEQ